MVQARVVKKDPEAIYFIGRQYYQGRISLQRDMRMTVEVWSEAAELGSIEALYFLGGLYDRGDVVQQDKSKAAELWRRRRP